MNNRKRVTEDFSSPSGHALFVIDRSPSGDKIAPILPPTKFTTPLTGEKLVEAARSSTGEPEKEDSLNAFSKRLCFNCGKPGHIVGDCPERYNPETVRKNRIKHRAGQRKDYGRARRFVNHGYEPGKISDELRRAIGLGRHELPPWIYRMRCCGYPPGYKRIASARIPKLGFHDDASNMSDVEYEEFDERCIVEYPGFNAPLPDGVVDEYRLHHAPPFSLHRHGKQRMIKEIKRKLERDERHEVKAKKRRLDENVASNISLCDVQAGSPSADKDFLKQVEPSGSTATEKRVQVDDEILSISSDETNSVEVITESEEIIDVDDEEPSTSSDVIKSGEILAEREGTPAPFVVHKYGFEKPSLEIFSAGLQKFEFQKETQTKGVSFFKRLFSLRKEGKSIVEQFWLQRGGKPDG